MLYIAVPKRSACEPSWMKACPTCDSGGHVFGGLVADAWASTLMLQRLVVDLGFTTMPRGSSVATDRMACAGMPSCTLGTPILKVATKGSEPAVGMLPDSSDTTAESPGPPRIPNGASV